MSELVYGKRIDAHISGQDVNALDIHRETVSEKIKDFKELYDSTLFIKDFPPNSINTHKIEAYLTKLKAKIGKNIDIIIVDYINLLRPNEKTDGGMYERVGEVSRDLRALSYKFEAPVISPTQSNREGWDTSDVAMSNVSESAGIAHTADFIGALWQQEGDREANRLNLTVLKNRNGLIGRSYEFNINYKTLRITDVDREELNEEDENLTDDIFDSITM
jgi:replicative DNA helicase